MTQLAYADTACYTQFSLKAELQLKNKVLLVGGWWMGVGWSCWRNGKEGKAQLQLGLIWGFG